MVTIKPMKTANTIANVRINVNECLMALWADKHSQWSLTEDIIARFNNISICDVHEQLSIFACHKDILTFKDLKAMKAFLDLALDLGLTGHCCFNVGSNGSVSGMWAYENVAIDGQLPSTGKGIYRTFLSAKNPKHYTFDMDDGNNFTGDYESVKEFTAAFLAAQTK